MTRVLVAGDHFVTPTLIVEALHDRLGPAMSTLDIHELTLPWPHTPFGRVAEVDEASGDEEALAAAVAGAEIAITQMAPFTARVLAAATSLRLVVVCRGGPVNVNLDAARAAGVSVRATPGRNAVAAAEHTIALLLAALRQIPDIHNGVRAGQWRSDLYALDAVGGELSGATVGLIGYGAIGQRVGRILSAFDARVLVHDPYAVDVASVGLDELLERSAAVSLHARLTPETAGMVGAKELARLPRGAVLVNTARGGLLDYEAVVDALESGHLGGAAFDVYAEEPIPPASRLLTAPRVVLTPHLAGATRQTAERAATLAAAEVATYLNV